MDRFGLISLLVEPTLLLAIAVAAGVPLLLLPSPAGLPLAVAAVAAGIWLNHRLEESVRRLPVRVGPESMQGQSAVVLEPLRPAGVVRCGGELWRAIETRGRPVSHGEKVRVVRVRGLRLEVEKADC